ncbi:hypothetical protein HGM15179_019619 [Zosterops borbonicus]|uniref:Uncharacterized protein n=1 Tax=Zosterops borbonicus TaxID=364589 RepID=A0A8K1D8F0_9PASS|nr:hypothetical protein HGM15179_019619 [Zosterops borbonicus]
MCKMDTPRSVDALKRNKDSTTKGYEVGMLYSAPGCTGDSSTKDGHLGAEPVSIAGVTGGSQHLTHLEAEVSLTQKEWKKHPNVTGAEALCILGIDYLRSGYSKDPKGLRMIRELDTQGVVSKTHSLFNSSIWSVHNSNGEWRMTVVYHGLNEVKPSLSAAVLDILELQYELESKAAKWYTTIDIANGFSPFL